MQAITILIDEYIIFDGVKSVKLRASNGNTICIHEINGELVIKNE